MVAPAQRLVVVGVVGAAQDLDPALQEVTVVLLPIPLCADHTLGLLRAPVQDQETAIRPEESISCCSYPILNGIGYKS